MDGFRITKAPHEQHQSALQTACLFILAFALAIFTGCRQDMQDQPKFLPLRGTSFYADGRSARPQVPGTVARSQNATTSYLLNGLIDGKEADVMPFPATANVLARGQERYNIYCSPCHSRVGNGLGMIVQRGYHLAGDFHTLRLRSAPLAHFVNVMSHGYGAMPDYSAQLTPQDRWSVGAYIRALQLSQHANRADIEPGATVEPLARSTVRTGLPLAFAQPWNLDSVLPYTPSVAAFTPTPPAPSQPPEPPVAGLTPGSSAMAVHRQLTRLTAAPVTSAQSGAQPSDSHGAYIPYDTTIAQAGIFPSPAVKATPPHDAEAGAQIYKRSCSMCHQPDRSGLPPTIPSLIGVVNKVGADHIRSVILTGIPTARPPMPPFADSLSTDDISNVITFLGSPK